LRHYVEAIQAHPAFQNLFRQLGRDNPIKVLSVDSIQGVTSDVVHVVRARRHVETPDQYFGIQGDEKREYICYTRGQSRTTVWLEVEPHGVPGDVKTSPPGDVLNRGGLTARRRNNIIIETPFSKWRVFKQNWDLPHYIREELTDFWVPGPVLAGMRARTVEWIRAPDLSDVLEDHSYANVSKAIRGIATMDEHCRDFVSATLQEAREAGIGRAKDTVPIGVKDQTPSEEGRYSFEAACRLGFAVPSLVVNIAESSQAVQLCIPVLTTEGMEKFEVDGDASEVALRSFIQVIKTVHKIVWHDSEVLVPMVKMHKAEVRELEGTLWWSKTCRSNRQAVVLLDESRSKPKQKRVYLYWGGQSLRQLWSTTGVQPLVCRTKTWNLAVSVSLAVLVVTACSPGWHPLRLQGSCCGMVSASVDDSPGEEGILQHDDSDADEAPEEVTAEIKEKHQASGAKRLNPDTLTDTFVGRYDNALERLLAAVGPLRNLPRKATSDNPAPELPCQTPEDAWANYDLLRPCFPVGARLPPCPGPGE
jgi:hypothetical protein